MGNKCQERIRCPKSDLNPQHASLIEGALTTRRIMVTLLHSETAGSESFWSNQKPDHSTQDVTVLRLSKKLQTFCL